MAAEGLIQDYYEHERKNAWVELFRDIDSLTARQEKDLGLKTEIARAWVNVEKNRYRNVLTYDTSRVTLRRTRAGSSNYINASPLKVQEAHRRYIMTQGPLGTTCNDFWQMIWEQKCALIVMLNKLFEKNSVKCHAYYPTEENPEIEFDTFIVSLKTEEHFSHFVVRTLQVQPKETSDSFESSSDQDRNSSSTSSDSDSDDDDEDSEESARTVFHFQFTSWPDFGVPGCPHVFLEFLYRVRSTGLLRDSPPAVVHCSAGIGRSGAFVVVDSILSMVEHQDEPIDVIQLILRLRRSRMGLIQTSQQLQFCWKTVAEALRGDKSGCDCDTEPSEWPKIRRSTENPPLLRSAANQMTSGEMAKSLSDLSSLRKRSVGEPAEKEEDVKRSKRRILVETMRERLRESERKRPKRILSMNPDSQHFFGYAILAAAAAVGVYCLYRLYT